MADAERGGAALIEAGELRLGRSDDTWCLYAHEVDALSERLAGAPPAGGALPAGAVGPAAGDLAADAAAPQPESAPQAELGWVDRVIEGCAAFVDDLFAPIAGLFNRALPEPLRVEPREPGPPQPWHTSPEAAEPPWRPSGYIDPSRPYRQTFVGSAVEGPAVRLGYGMSVEVDLVVDAECDSSMGALTEPTGRFRTQGEAGHRPWAAAGFAPGAVAGAGATGASGQPSIRSVCKSSATAPCACGAAGLFCTG